MNNLFGNCSTAPNNWDPTKDAAGQTNIQPSDPRIRDVFITTLGGLSGSGAPYPVVSLAAFYITGWDGASGSCTSGPNKNEDVPRDFTGFGTSVWGHYIQYVDLTTGTNPSTDPCDLTQSVILCRPTLVR